MDIRRKERKKETVRPGKAGEQSEKSQETGNGPPARHSRAALSRSRSRDRVFFYSGMYCIREVPPDVIFGLYELTLRL